MIESRQTSKPPNPSFLPLPSRARPRLLSRSPQTPSPPETLTPSLSLHLTSPIPTTAVLQIPEPAPPAPLNTAAPHRRSGGCGAQPRRSQIRSPTTTASSPVAGGHRRRWIRSSLSRPSPDLLLPTTPTTAPLGSDGTPASHQQAARSGNTIPPLLVQPADDNSYNAPT